MALPVSQSRVAALFFLRSTFVVCFTFPVGYTLYYMSALDAHCHDSPDVFFDNFRQRKTFVIFMCFQTLISRIPVLLSSSRLMQLSCGYPLQSWAANSRFKWAVVTASVALLTDAAIQITLRYRSDFCDNQPDNSKWNTIGPLCRHSAQVSTIGMVFHLMAIAFTIGLLTSLITWYTMLSPNSDIKQKGF